MEDLLNHVLYTSLGWEMGNEGHILFTDPLSIPKAFKEQVVQLMFETMLLDESQTALLILVMGR